MCEAVRAICMSGGAGRMAEQTEEGAKGVGGSDACKRRVERELEG